MVKIATHDSATGERGQGILSWLVTPFARTQSKTIKEQYEAGCRMFDIRVKEDGSVWRCAHGLWKSERTAYHIIWEIDNLGEPCYVTITYEGKYAPTEFGIFVDNCKKYTKNIIFGGISIKYGKGSNLFKVKYEYIEPFPKDWPANKQGFLPLDGKTWHILLPIPWLWKKLYHNKVEFNDKIYKYVDFL